MIGPFITIWGYFKNHSHKLIGTYWVIFKVTGAEILTWLINIMKWLRAFIFFAATAPFYCQKGHFVIKHLVILALSYAVRVPNSNQTALLLKSR